jgi:hypothetical protein
VRIDEPRKHVAASTVDDGARAGRRILARRANVGDQSILDRHVHRSVRRFAAAVHHHDVPNDQARHGFGVACGRTRRLGADGDVTAKQ